MSEYECPMCKMKIQGDLVAFLEHGREEISRALRKKYPDWDESKGICPKCRDHYENWFDSQIKKK